MLDACSTWVECNYVPRSEAPLTYMVSFYSTDEMRRDGIPDVYAIIDLKVEKDEVVDFGLSLIHI